MKTRESGMPPEDVWKSFFEPTRTLEVLGLRQDMSNVVDLGCGYGTFTIPAAQITGGTVHGFDIEESMIEATRARAASAGCRNIDLHLRDFVAEGTGLPDAVSDYVMLFNLLHAEDPALLLRESFRILTAYGLLAITHWNYDPETPRGPSMEIRVRPDECARWAREAGFSVVANHVDLPPYHYGVIAQKA